MNKNRQIRLLDANFVVNAVSVTVSGVAIIEIQVFKSRLWRKSDLDYIRCSVVINKAQKSTRMLAHTQTHAHTDLHIYTRLRTNARAHTHTYARTHLHTYIHNFFSCLFFFFFFFFGGASFVFNFDCPIFFFFFFHLNCKDKRAL